MNIPSMRRALRTHARMTAEGADLDPVNCSRMSTCSGVLLRKIIREGAGFTMFQWKTMQSLVVVVGSLVAKCKGFRAVDNTDSECVEKFRKSGSGET